MKTEFNIPNGTGLAVWYDGELIAVLTNPTKTMVEKAVCDYNCFTSSEIIEPVSFDANKFQYARAHFKFDDNGEIFYGFVQLTCVNVYISKTPMIDMIDVGF